MRRRRLFWIAPAALAGLALFGFIVMLLWNHVVAASTGWHELSYWQALGLLVLSKILFGFGGGHSRGHWRRRSWQNWEAMQPEEREKFREAMRARYGSSWCEPRPPRDPEAPPAR